MKFILLSLFTFTFVSGFGYKVHTLLGLLVEKNLSNNTLYKLKNLGYPTNFGYFSTWADLIKRSREYSWTRKLHYFDIPSDPPNSCQLINYPDATQPLNLLQFLDVCIQQKTNLTEFQFKIMIHLLQDMHQPLHLTGKLKGGNSQEIFFDNKHMSLHSFWDTKLFEYLYSNNSLQEQIEYFSLKINNSRTCSKFNSIQDIIDIANEISLFNCNIVWNYNKVDYVYKSSILLDNLIVKCVETINCFLDSFP
jgi:hypothetical protein